MQSEKNHISQPEFLKALEKVYFNKIFFPLSLKDQINL